MRLWEVAVHNMSAETSKGGGSAGGKIGGGLHRGGMSSGLNITIPEYALGVSDVNFTTGLGTGGSSMTLAH